MIKIELTMQEVAAIVGLMDAGLRTVGLKGLRPEAASAFQKLDEAVKKQSKTQGDEQAKED